MYLFENIRNGQRFYDAGRDMAIQDYILNHLDLDDDVIFPYLSEPKVQIGRYQNTAKEINLGYAKEHHIQVSRRDTGGGALYIDSGSPAFCYIFIHPDRYNDYDALYAPVIEALKQLGVDHVTKPGRNDLEVNGQKISGAAMRIVNDRIHAGYSILIEVDDETMSQVLTPDRLKIESKGIDSIRKRVRGIRHLLAPQYQQLTNQEITDLITCQILGVQDLSQAKRLILNENDWEIIDRLCEEKYQNWDWNYGKDPAYNQQRTLKFPGGLVESYAEIVDGRIQSIEFRGDFFGSRSLQPIEVALVGCRMEADELLKQLSHFDLSHYFGTITAQELVTVILS